MYAVGARRRMPRPGASGRVAAQRTHRGDGAAVVGAGLAGAGDGVAEVVDDQGRDRAEHDRTELEVAPLARFLCVHWASRPLTQPATRDDPGRG